VWEDQAITPAARGGDVLSDTELIEFVEKHGVQVWPQRARADRFNKAIVARTPGEILNWTAQYPRPFVQMTRGTFRAAVTDLKEALKK
jgi:hypothetical protein